MPPTKQTFLVGGLPVHVFQNSGVSTKPAIVLFLLHGRTQRAEDSAPIAQAILDGEDNLQRDIIVVTFDHRNHGHRLVDAKANDGWSKDPETCNVTHALDMYSIQTGTAKDVSFLIDYLPSYLFPSGDRTISEWGVVGVSLGGHSTWISLSQDPRVTIGVPIIGCPDYLALISGRAQANGISLDDRRYFPDSLRAQIVESDPVSTAYRINGPTNPFLNKKILVLSGAVDPLVPWSASELFVEGLQVGDKGVKKVVIEAGAGHEVTPAAVKELVAFVRGIALENK